MEIPPINPCTRHRSDATWMVEILPIQLGFRVFLFGVIGINFYFIFEYVLSLLICLIASQHRDSACWKNETLALPGCDLIHYPIILYSSIKVWTLYHFNCEAYTLDVYIFFHKKKYTLLTFLELSLNAIVSFYSLVYCQELIVLLYIYFLFVQISRGDFSVRVCWFLFLINDESH